MECTKCGRYTLVLWMLVAIGAGTGVAEAAETQDPADLQEVLITGTSIRGIAPTGSSPIQVERETIEASGTRTTAELLATIPQIAQFNTVPTGLTSFGQAVASISLRPNLGAGATLVLINGHRLVLSGATVGVVDPSALPPAAIERVEVVADGASAIYGSDAVGGVINFITRKSFTGAETSVRGSTSSYDYSAYDLSQAFGTSWDGGSLMVSAQYIGHSRLETNDLDFYSNVGTTTGLSPACAVASVGASVPPCDAAKLGDLQPNDRRIALFASGKQSLTASLEAWGDLQYSRDRRSQFDAMTAFPNATSFAATNFYNTTGVARSINYRPIPEFGEGLPRDTDLDVMQGTLGLDYAFRNDWRATSHLSYGESKNHIIAAGLNNVAYQRAMAGTTAATAFDPFTHRSSAAVLADILDGADDTDVDQSLLDFLVKADGPVFSLPAGAVRIAIGGEFRRETQQGSRRVGSPNSVLATGRGYLSSGDADADRDVKSLLAEVFIPIIGREQSVPLFTELSLSIAGRHDDYSDAGGTTNPKIGINWKMTDWVRAYGTVSKSFQAPPLGSSVSGAVDTRVQTIFGQSPFTPPGLYTGTNGLVIAGGSENLVPQTSRNYSYGIEFTPTLWEGFRATVTHYHVDFKNFIGLPIGAFTNPTLAQYGILAPVVNGAIVPFTASSPQVTQFTSRLPVDGGVLPAQIGWIALLQRVNLSRRVQGGIDYDVSQRLDLGRGSLLARVAGSYILRDSLSGTPGAVFQDVRSTDNRNRYSASLDYRLGGFAVGGSFNHLDHRYSTVAITPTRALISAFDIVNLRGSYEFAGEGTWLGGVQLSLNIDNAFDEDPPRQTDAAGGVFANATPFGRMFSVGLRKRW